MLQFCSYNYQVSECERKGKQNCFSLQTPSRTYYFLAESADERAAWMQSINTAIEDVKSSTEEFDGKLIVSLIHLTCNVPCYARAFFDKVELRNFFSC